jgi:2'-5' RNA ligase
VRFELTDPARQPAQPLTSGRRGAGAETKTMTHFVIAPLDASPEDLARIEAVRARHDPRHRLVGPHVTLVFGFAGAPLAPVVEHVAGIAALHLPIRVRLVEHRAVRDHDGPGSHVFLTLEQGNAEVVALHDALYAGPLGAELRGDVAFIPHVTVAASRDPGEAEALARTLGAVDVTAVLSRLELVTLAGATLSLERRFDLGARSVSAP